MHWHYLWHTCLLLFPFLELLLLDTSCSFFYITCFYQLRRKSYFFPFLNAVLVLWMPCVPHLCLCYSVYRLLWTHPSLHTKTYNLLAWVSFIKPFILKVSFPHDLLTLCRYLPEMYYYFLKIFTQVITYIISTNMVWFYLATQIAET